MPNNVLANSNSNSNDKGNKIDTSLLVRKPYLRTKNIEANIEDIDMKNTFRIENLPDPISIREATSRNYVHNKINDIVK